jgi:hypothetical protein
MNERLKQSVERLLNRAKSANVAGRTVEKNEIEEVNSRLSGLIPGWYVELLTKYPLCGLEFWWQQFPEEDDFDGRSNVLWSRPSDIWDETHEAYPGIAILEEGFFNVGCDCDGMGDPYFIDSKAGEDPPVYRVYHEGAIGADARIGGFDADVVAKSLSDFFDSMSF